MTKVTPVDVLPYVIVDYEVTTSSDEALPEYDSLEEGYTLGAEVKVAADKKKYKLAADTVAVGVIPKDNPDTWQESPLVEFAMFDYNNDYQSTFAGNYSCVIGNASGMDTLFLQDVDGDTITVELLDDSDNVLDSFQEDIYDWDITDFGKYLFPDEPELLRKIQFDFMNIQMSKIRITISGTTTGCRYAVAGYKEYLGLTLRDGIGYNQNNFFTSSRDAWGNLIDTDQRLIEDVSLPVIDYNKDVNKNANKTAKLFATPHLFIADDRDKANVEFEFINLFGVLKSNNIVPGAQTSQKTLKIEGK